jgi:uncharacterized protein YndB with AHSA1/START domain
MHYIERNVEIDAPVERVFDLFSDFESMPRWMKNIVEVRYTGRRHTRWIAGSPYSDHAEWEAETTAFEPDHRIAWRSVRGDIRTEGEAVFEETRRGTTLLRVVLGWDPNNRGDGRVIRDAFGEDPARQLEENLERLADVAEGRRHGRPVREQRVLRSQRVGDDRIRDERDVSFVRAPRDARRDQERYQRYADVRDERRYNYSGALARRDDRRRIQDDRRYVDENGEASRVRYEEGMEAEPVYRHAMTPRERAAERDFEDDMQRQRRYEESSRFMRRGVDRLMEEPPSSRWNDR